MFWPPVIALALAAAACGDNVHVLTCVPVDLTCQPLYPPTFENVHATTLSAKCGDDRVACHSTAGAQGGLALGDLEASYQALLAERRVIPGDASCSELVMRIYSDDRDLVMPQGSRLSDPEACAVARWVAAGAPGPVVDARPADAAPPDAELPDAATADGDLP